MGLNFAWIDTIAYLVYGQPLQHVVIKDTYFKVLAIPLKSLPNEQKKFLMAWLCGKNLKWLLKL